MNNKKIEEKIKKDGEELEATLNLLIEGLTIGELKEILKRTDKLEEEIEKNILTIENNKTTE